MGKNSDQTHQKHTHRVESVLSLLRKQSPLTLKQEKFCNNACVERFLKSKGDNVKKAAKQLRACLSWRESIGTVFSFADHLIADEFSSELAEGIAYVSGHDDESRPVMIFRIKQDYQKLHSQKLFTRLLVFTLEVAVQSMPRNAEQFVLLFDASKSTTTSNDYIALFTPIDNLKLKGISGVRPFVELSPLINVVSSLDFEESMEFNDFYSCPRSSSLRFDPSSTAKIGPCSSTRFSFSVSQSLDSLKPWHLSLTDTSSFKSGPTAKPHSGSNPLGPALISTLNARSFSFASPVARTPRGGGFYPLTPLPQKTQMADAAVSVNRPMTPKPSSSSSSFLQSPATFFRKECHVGKSERSRDSFLPFLKLYRRPYDEMTYRSKMRPPLGGLISIVSPHLVRRRHVSVSQRF
ncbi:hypothetical protein RHGRI_012336 [Rhododendron griersonianum]|uniref:CRAL-TRIO domain-containing protein n=1 Tax=Rhododendron griersonianum TaxID=479676 RepID=A0AAV6KR51_9ERIC|nr:hypothetical protein RHGRI_012336 [Rhododendron griersonianum]